MTVRELTWRFTGSREPMMTMPQFESDLVFVIFVGQVFLSQ
jgi:hypothetical protein